MQALVLTHELTNESDFDTYLARRLAPVRPLISFGRSAKAWPECEAQVAVFCWWRDPPQHCSGISNAPCRCCNVLSVMGLSLPPPHVCMTCEHGCCMSKDVALPLMCDPRWEKDTLFLVFEEDFRFSEDEFDEPEFIKAKTLQEVVGEEPEPAEKTGRTKMPIGFSNKASGLSSDFFFGRCFDRCCKTCLFPAVEPAATANHFRECFFCSWHSHKCHGPHVWHITSATLPYTTPLHHAHCHAVEPAATAVMNSSAAQYVNSETQPTMLV